MQLIPVLVVVKQRFHLQVTNYIQNTLQVRWEEHVYSDLHRQAIPLQSTMADENCP